MGHDLNMDEAGILPRSDKMCQTGLLSSLLLNVFQAATGFPVAPFQAYQLLLPVVSRAFLWKAVFSSGRAALGAGLLLRFVLRFRFAFFFFLWGRDGDRGQRREGGCRQAARLGQRAAACL